MDDEKSAARAEVRQKRQFPMCESIINCLYENNITNEKLQIIRDI